ncbi:tyrosyl-DNA phosphodiesterase-domain-containing protein [Pisolithus croceorrhizus]|nr:tyrosyl-DNA phosphodiesterase-domain-containing protein [Pisolithus croceorrhizus]
MDNSDDDLARAITLSLMEHGSSLNHRGHYHDVAELQFQQDLRHAIEVSSSESNTPGISSKGSCSGRLKSNATTPSLETQTNTTAPPNSFLTERAQLERERLDRLKRQRGEENQDEMSSSSTKRQNLSTLRSHTDERTPTPSTSSASSSKASSSVNNQKATAVAKPAVSTNPVVDQLFWDGELRPTANLHSMPRQDGKPTFRLTEVLGPKSQITFAIISSYSTVVSWIYEFFEPRTPVILVAQPDLTGQAGIKNILPNWVMTVPFLRNGHGCQHMKFMLIFYETGRLRVVISTANLIDYDWRDIENAVWLQDIPPLPQSSPQDHKITNDFPSIMEHVLRSVNARDALTNMLTHAHPNLPLQTIGDLHSKWDWSKVKVKLVPSIAGKHEGWPKVVQSGHPRLMKALRDFGLRTGKGKAAKELAIECQGSSIGTYSTQWLNEFYYSARGESAEDWLDEPKARRTKLPWPPVKILFPSLRTVKGTVLGESVCGGTMFCRANQWGGTRFPRELFYDSNSVGGKVLMHTKMIIATFRQKSTPFSAPSSFKASSATASTKGKGKSTAEPITISDSETESESEDDRAGVDDAAPSSSAKEPIGWAYVGSHNFTPSAWGTLSGSGFNPTLNNVNYELGILFPLYSNREVERVSCFKRPPRKYVLGEDRPWIQEESPVFMRA